MPFALSALALLAVLAFAVARPRGLPEAVLAVPVALTLLICGLLPLPDALDEAATLAPVLVFLAAMLVISEVCAAEGLFVWAGAVMARGSAGNGPRLLRLVFLIGAVVTAVLSLDATVVLLTPVVFATAARVGLPARPQVYACAHLANSASLLLPVSNLTNLLALNASGLSFGRFAGLMTLPWLAAIAVEYVVLRRWFAGDLSLPGGPSAPHAAGELPRLPRVVSVVLALMLAGFACSHLIGIEPVWLASAAALGLAVRALARRTVSPGGVFRSLNLGFVAFVLALGLVVTAVLDNGLAQAVSTIVPGSLTLPALLGWAGLAVVAANLVNNLPAVLVLLPLAAGQGAPAVLAVLIGVNIGPNLTYVGSLATLLWRRVVAAHDHLVRVVEFTGLGLVSTPLAVVAAVLGLWVGLALLGGG